MTDKLTRAYINAQHKLTSRYGRDEGQGALEYVGVLVIVSLIVGLAYTAVNGAGVSEKVTSLISEIFAGGSQAGG